jgi:hypothetical protein
MNSIEIKQEKLDTAEKAKDNRITDDGSVPQKENK